MKFMIPLLLALPFADTARAAEKSSLKLTPEWSSYFGSEVAKIENSGLSSITNLTEWEAQKPVLRQRLAQMLGLWPEPPRTDLHPVVTGTLDGEGFWIEKVHFQAAPQLYVTGNLYLPAKTSGKAPAVLYVCGHSRVVTNGVSCGNKSAYQHHGSWFARNGFVCLVIDTLQYGEILASHRGTYSDNQWWWNSRGYTPAGVEAWFGIRALDYLCSRPEVDPGRIGMTGRSGGGAYTWTVAALDDRVKIAAPIAGMTDLRNQVLDGKVDGHCDCMFQVNTYRWDFPMIGALIAPRPLMIGNSDKDRIFPLDGVIRTHDQIRRIYALYGKEQDLGLLITEGDHLDTQDLQVPVFRWFTKLLKPESQWGEQAASVAATQFFTPEQLRVFDKLPSDERNTTAAEWFNLQPAKFSGKTAGRDALRDELRTQCFAAWPQAQPEAKLSQSSKPVRRGDLRITAHELPVQSGVTQRLFSVALSAPKKPRHVSLIVADDEFLRNSGLFSPDTAEPGQILEAIRAIAPENDGTVHIFVPRAVGLSPNAKQEDAIRLRRRFMLVGTTLDSMRVWDIRCAIHAVKQLYGKMPITVAAAGPMAVNSAYAALFEPAVSTLKLQDVPAAPRQMPDYLNVFKVIEGVPAIAARE